MDQSAQGMCLSVPHKVEQVNEIAVEMLDVVPQCLCFLCGPLADLYCQCLSFSRPPSSNDREARAIRRERDTSAGYTSSNRRQKFQSPRLIEPAEQPAQEVQDRCFTGTIGSVIHVESGGKIIDGEIRKGSKAVDLNTLEIHG